jgi:hypothetical protein
MVQPVTSFQELASLFRRMASTVDVLTRDFGPEWVAGSPGQRDSTYEPGFAGDWGDRPLETGVMYVPALLNHAGDHMRALAASLDEENVVMATYTLLRPIIDSCARVAYLLEPGLPPLERLRRGTNMRLLSLNDEFALMTGVADGDDEEGMAYYGDTMTAIARSARPLGLSMTTPKIRNGYRNAPYLGPPHPGEMALAEALLGRTESGVGRTTYRLASAFVHGRPHAWRFMNADVVKRVSPGILEARFGSRLDRYMIVAVAPVLALNQAGLDTAVYAGFPSTVWTDVAQPILQIWQASIHASMATAHQMAGDDLPLA